jgi:hypothetical protein
VLTCKPAPLPAVIVARGCLYLGTEIANSPCSWCAGNMSPPRLPPGGRRHLLPDHLPHGRTVAGAGVPRCAGHGHGGRVRACRVVRARSRHACDVFASPAADAPSRARRLCRADARSSGEGAAARTKRERVGRAGDIADASAVVCRVRVSVLRFWDR